MPKKTKSYRDYLNKYSLLAGIAFALIVVYIFKLASLTKGLSLSEIAINSKFNANSIVNNPIFLPIKTMRLVIFSIFSHPSIFTVRLISVIFGLLSIFIIYKLINTWLGRNAAIYGTILFSLTAWNLHVSRLADNSVMYVFAISLFLYSTTLIKRYVNNSSYFLFVTAFVWPMLAYIPGMIFLIGYNAIRQKADLKKGFNNLSKNMYFIYLIAAIVWLPLLIIFFLKNISNILVFLGLPTTLSGLTHYPINLLKTIEHIFLLGPNNPQIWVGRMPVLDFFVLVTAIIGAYYYINHLGSNQSKLLAFSFIISTLLIAANNPDNIGYVIPIMFVLSATGIALIIKRWMSIFPRNPIARTFAFSFIAVAIFTSCVYNLRSYFIAWPHDPSTKKVFIYKDSI